MTALHVLRVFVGKDGGGGNPLAVFVDGSAIPSARRQKVAADLGLSETVFVDDAATGRIAIFTPARELPFAGHPAVGTSWLLAELGRPVETLRPPAGEARTWRDDDLTWVRARPEWIHHIDFEQLAAPADVEALTGPPPGSGSWYPWAWIDEPAGAMRSRYFVEELGIAEDEATGAAAVAIGGMLRRPLTIRQGVGSELYVLPGPDGTVEIGGRCGFLETREYEP